MAAAQSKNQEILDVAKSLRGTPWCDEYERMISGMLYVLSPVLHIQAEANSPARYNPLHPTLLEGRHKARCVSYKYNNLDPNDYDFEKVAEVRTELLREILGRVGEGTCIETPFLPDYGCNIIIGENCFMNFGQVRCPSNMHACMAD